MLSLLCVASSLSGRSGWNSNSTPAWLAGLRIWFSGEWGIWLPVVQALGLATLFWRFGCPARATTWLWLIGLNGWLVTLAALSRQTALDRAVAIAGDLLLRVTVVSLWSFAVLGLPRVVFWIWRHRRAPRPPFVFGRCWFSTVVLLVAAEPLMALLERSQASITFPERLEEPPAGEVRIVSLGGSTMVGHPYAAKFGIPQLLAWRVQQMYPQRQIVSENLAVPGANLKQAIAELHRLRYRPHLVLLYSGHNEFLHDLGELGGVNDSLLGACDGVLNFSPMFRVVNLRLRQSVVLRSLRLGARRELVEWPVCGPSLLEYRRLRFRRQLEQLAEFGRSQGIAMLWYVPAASESGYEPNWSIVAPGTPQTAIAGLYECSRRAAERERAGDWPAAVDLYRESLLCQPQFAEFHFRLAECLMKQGRTGEARGHYQQALDDDGYPVRAVRPYRTAVAEVGASFSIPTVVSDDVLRRNAPHQILDRSLFHDNVHPTLRGFYHLGMAGADALHASRLLEPSFGIPDDIPEVSFEDAVGELHIDRHDIAGAHRGIANGLRWLAGFRFDGTRRVQQADLYLRLAERLETGEIEPGEEGTESLR